ncbi:Steroid C26-monooxygenase [Paraconexibacter sp. AEG42_29]|uniref:Steroid C26-monooxygenase n=2 Tax=Paraconexibacter sp. AEG42_29 TaxID=2997339 RepID=A0AAU7APD5_9ACTN
MGLAETYDHFAPEFARDPFGLWASLRTEEPVARSECHGGFHVVTRYADIDRAARDPETFTSTDGTGIPALPMVGMIPIDIDPPAQRAYRKVMDPALTIGPVMEREAAIRQLATDLIDPLVGRAQFDAAQDLAIFLPPRATLGFLGFPEEDHELMRLATDDVTRLRGQDTPRIMEAGGEMIMTCVKLVNARRAAAPQDDLLQLLLDGEFEGRPLKDEEIVQYLSVLLFGAIDTTASAIAGSIWYLATHPEDQARLRELDEIPNAALDELLRWVSPLQGLGRTVTKDTELGGCPLHAGDRVLLMWASGNRDESVFESPDDVDLDRRPNRHLAFGMGPHRCAGVHLGKLMMRVALEEFLQRIGPFELGEGELVWLGGEARGLRAVPIRPVAA